MPHTSASSTVHTPKLIEKLVLQSPFSSLKTPPQPALSWISLWLPSVLNLHHPHPVFSNVSTLVTGILLSVLEHELPSKALLISLHCSTIHKAILCTLLMLLLKMSSLSHFHNHNLVTAKAAFHSHRYPSISLLQILSSNYCTNNLFHFCSAIRFGTSFSHTTSASGHRRRM